MTTFELLEDLWMVNEYLLTEQSEEVYASLEAAKARLQANLLDKADNIDLFIVEVDKKVASTEGEIKVLQAEVQRLKNRCTALTNSKKFVTQEALPLIIKAQGVDGKLETTRAKYKLYETYGAVVIDELALGDNFYTEKTTRSVNKVAAKKAAIKAIEENTGPISGVSISKVERVRRT